jgi:hypothetical protein
MFQMAAAILIAVSLDKNFSGSLPLLRIDMFSQVAIRGVLLYLTGFGEFHSGCLSPGSSWGGEQSGPACLSKQVL